MAMRLAALAVTAALVGVVAEAKAHQLELIDGIDSVRLWNAERADEKACHRLMAAGVFECEAIIGAQEDEDVDGSGIAGFDRCLFNILSIDGKLVLGSSIFFPWENYATANLSDLGRFSGTFPSKSISFGLDADSGFQQERFPCHKYAASGRIAGVFENVSHPRRERAPFKSELLQIGINRDPWPMLGRKISTCQVNGTIGGTQETLSGSPQGIGEGCNSEGGERGEKSVVAVNKLQRTDRFGGNDPADDLAFLISLLVAGGVGVLAYTGLKMGCNRIFGPNKSD
jgi:hypothetical protein